MFARHPLELSKDKLSEKDLVDALRLAVIAELDAISFYLQVAEKSSREDVKKVFIDVANEEKTHVGEFLEMLKRLDPGQAEELRRGAEEVAELVGGKANGDDPPQSGNSDAGVEEIVPGVFKRVVEENRVLRRHLPVSLLGPGVDYVAAPSIAYGEAGVVVESETVIPLREVSVELVVPARLFERHKRLGEPLEPLVEYAAKRFVAEEERLLLRQLLGTRDALKTGIGSWERPGEAVDDVARAVAMLGAEGFHGPYLLLVSPQRYARLLAVHERTGVMELARIEKLARVVRTPLLSPEQAILVSAEKTGLDIVVGVDTRVDYIGLEQGGHRFRASETIALRVFNPHSIVVLTQE